MIVAADSLLGAVNYGPRNQDGKEVHDQHKRQRSRRRSPLRQSSPHPVVRSSVTGVPLVQFYHVPNGSSSHAVIAKSTMPAPNRGVIEMKACLSNKAVLQLALFLAGLLAVREQSG